jgi:hypothetical protein
LAILRGMCCRETDSIGKIKTMINSKDNINNFCQIISTICKRTMVTLLSIWQKVSDNLWRHSQEYCPISILRGTVGKALCHKYFFTSYSFKSLIFKFKYSLAVGTCTPPPLSQFPVQQILITSAPREDFPPAGQYCLTSRYTCTADLPPYLTFPIHPHQFPLD